LIARNGEGISWPYAFEPVDTPIGPTFNHSGVFYPTDWIFLMNLFASYDGYLAGDIPS
jgi:hypothetical protein